MDDETRAKIEEFERKLAEIEELLRLYGEQYPITPPDLGTVGGP